MAPFTTEVPVAYDAHPGWVIRRPVVSSERRPHLNQVAFTTPLTSSFVDGDVVQIPTFPSTARPFDGVF